VRLGSIDDLIARGSRRSAPVTAVACAALRLRVERATSLEAARRDLARVALPLAPFRGVVADEMALADLFGRLEVAARYQRALEADRARAWTQLEPTEALEAFRRRRLLAPRELSKLLDAYRRKATRIAGDLRDYMLGKVGDALQEAIRVGTTRAAFIRGLAERFDAWGLTRAKRHHVETVFDTTVLGSYAHGRYRQLTEPSVLAARPMWRYVTAGDSRVRPAHAAMNGRVYPADHEVWKRWFPPNGFRCRCSVESLTRDEARDLGGVSADPGAGLEPDEGFAISPRDWL
jgi:SPP1 gp7 family putative phage head morphogenesis protein